MCVCVCVCVRARAPARVVISLVSFYNCILFEGRVCMFCVTITVIFLKGDFRENVHTLSVCPY